MDKPNGSNPMASWVNYASGASSSRGAGQYLRDQRQSQADNRSTDYNQAGSEQASFERQFFEQPRHSTREHYITPAGDMWTSRPSQLASLPLPQLASLPPPTITAQRWADEFAASNQTRSVRDLTLVNRYLDELAQAKLPLLSRDADRMRQQFPNATVVAPEIRQTSTNTDAHLLTTYNLDFDKLSSDSGVRQDGDEYNMHFPETMAAMNHARMKL